MTKTLTLVWYFYRPLFIVNLFFSGLAIWSIALDGFATNNFLIKLLGYYACFIFQVKAKTHLFYLNAGHSIKKMYSYIFMLDFAFYLLMVACFYLLR